MAQLPSGFVSHSRKVCNLYKRLLRHIESSYYHLEDVRYESVILRAEFDKNKDIKDLRFAKEMMSQAEDKLMKDLHWNYKKFAESPGGCAFGRDHVPPDWIIDYWDPMEKAMYPKYFLLREQRKKEFEEFYKRNYANLRTATDQH
ncbi:NADH dehydrogenase [ubiquinone] 1 beta subcomplex subunit 9 [Copidosoma floridanum]|uniref:NADH dehydrogenase [ubiquinone] 1 beta subcomplex subunit 9 n=1 Tax=Copidosoma floridanum TaxID=29053 RepID=UPI0006C97B6F|nr:NADH dehydrogenase [ubiquinone] 1 beta subcomplex subunit 9 [Copidosoma floridanum]